jgi:hypothetical protein
MRKNVRQKRSTTDPVFSMISELKLKGKPVLGINIAFFSV